MRAGMLEIQSQNNVVLFVFIGSVKLLAFIQRLECTSRESTGVVLMGSSDEVIRSAGLSRHLIIHLEVFETPRTDARELDDITVGVFQVDIVFGNGCTFKPLVPRRIGKASGSSVAGVTSPIILVSFEIHLRRLSCWCHRVEDPSLRGSWVHGGKVPPR